MPVMTNCTSFRCIAVVVLTAAIALPLRGAHADGGRDPTDNAPSTVPAREPAPPQPAKPKTKPAPKTKTTTAQPRAVTTPRRTQQSRRTAPRIVETAPSGQPPEGETRFVADEVIVRFQLSSTETARLGAINRLGLTHLDVQTFSFAGVTVHRYRLPAGADVRSAIAELEASAAVVNAQPNYLYRLQQSESTGKLPQFGNDRIGLSEAHARTRGGGTRIAVIDAAVDNAHPELADARIATFDVTDGSANVDPHGTSVAGILAADARLTGVAPEANIVSIAAFAKDETGRNTGNTWAILEALNVAHDQRADILNMSFAGPADPLLERAMKGARERNILAVAAAGNEGPGAGPLFPAGYEAVIAVTATDAENAIYAHANIGEHVDIAAPGVGLLVLGDGAGYRTSSGTSMATAYVSGIAALVLSANPGADYATLRALLENSTTDLGDPGKDSIFGTGLPNAPAAIGGLAN